MQAQGRFVTAAMDRHRQLRLARLVAHIAFDAGTAPVAGGVQLQHVAFGILDRDTHLFETLFEVIGQ